MDWGSARLEMESHRTGPGTGHRLVSIVLILTGVASMVWPCPIEAAVYQCLDRAGKTVLTNKQSGLHACRTFIEGTPPPSTSSEAGMTPQGSPAPFNSEIPPAYQPEPMVPNRPAHDSSMEGWPAPHRGTPSSPPHEQPCSLGFNPLNPLSNPPCVKSDYPSEAPPIPSQ
jgi:hypothetical protein